MSKQDRSAARDLKGEHWGLSGSGLFRGAGMSSEELAWAGQEGGPLTLQPRLRFLRHLSRGAHRSVCPVLTVALCSKQPPPSQPQVGGVAWAQMPFMNGQSWRKAAPFRTGTAPHTSELTLEPPPSWQCRHCREPGHIGWRGMALPEGPPPPPQSWAYIPGEGSQVWKSPSNDPSLQGSCWGMVPLPCLLYLLELK